MVNLSQIGLIVFSGMAIAGGQGCMTAYAKSLPMPFDILTTLRYTSTALTFYGFLLLYGSGTIAMIYLLRTLPLAQVSISILGITILCTTALTHWFGHSLSLHQYAGILLIFAGVFLLQS